MKRTIAAIVVLILAQAGLEVSTGGVASAMVVLGGSTNCTLVSGTANFVPGLTTAPPNGDEKVQVFGHVMCNTPNVTPPVTAISGVFKGVIHFKKTPAPNKARQCSNFNGAAPIDTIVAPSKVIVNWSTNIGPARSVVMYSGTYSAIGTVPTMDLNFTPSTAVVTGSFAGSTAQLDMVLPIPAPQCPVATGVNTANSGSLVM